jgi:predicted nucleotidyltransferase
MRLSSEEITAIKTQVAAVDSDAKIYLFGSRIDDSKKGGDIDLLVVSEKITFEDKLNIRVQLYKQIGEQKIDILIVKDPAESVFASMAYEQGVLL